MWILFIILFPINILAQQNEVPSSVYLYTTPPVGLQTNSDSHNINDFGFSSCENILFDKDNSIFVRDGYHCTSEGPTSTGAVSNLFQYCKVNGTKYLIRVSSNVLDYSLTGVNFTTLISTMPLDSKTWILTYNDYCYIGTYTGDRWYFDGTSLYQSTSIPRAKHAIIYKDKMICANINKTNGGSRIEYSMIGDLNNWPSLNAGLVDKDNGDVINALTVYKGELWALKTYGIYCMRGFENDYYSDDGYDKIIDNIGCLFEESIKIKDNLLTFTSKRGVEQFNGVNIKLISEDIKPSIDNLLQMQPQTYNWTSTLQSDFLKGVYQYNTDTTTISGNIVVNSTGNCQVTGSTNTIWGGYPQNTLSGYQTFKVPVSNKVFKIRVFSGINTGSKSISFCIRGGDLTSGVTCSQNISFDSSGNGYLFTFPSTSLTKDVTYQLANTVGQFNWSVPLTPEGTGYDSYSGGEAWNIDNSSPVNNFYGGQEGTVPYDFKFIIYMTSCVYESEQKNVYSSQYSFTSWNMIYIQGSNLSNVNFYTRTASSQAGLNTTAWSNLSNYAIIPTVAQPWVQWKIETCDSTFQIDSVGIYYETDYSNIPLVAEIIDRRYWLSGATLDSNRNNIIYVYDKNNHWTKFTNIEAASFCVFKDRLYFGDSNNTGKIYEYSNTYTTDDGTTIIPSFTTKDFSLANWNKDIKLDNIWIEAKPSSSRSNLWCSYYINKSTYAISTSSIPLTAQTNYPSYPIIGKINRSDERVRYLGFNIANFDTFYGLKVGFFLEEEMEK